MKLLTQNILNSFQAIGRQEDSDDPIIICKFFNPVGSQSWYFTEYDPAERIFFGYVTGMAEDEWGYTSLDELENLRLPMGLKIERDLYFSEKHFSEQFGFYPFTRTPAPENDV